MKLEELKGLFPFYKFTDEGENIRVHFDTNSSMVVDLDNMPARTLQSLYIHHIRAELKNYYETMYPHLVVWVNNNPPYLVRTTWVKRGDQECEGMMSYANGMTWQQLEQAEELAEQANQEGMFYCSGCNKVKPKEQYAFFYFAGRYCLDCKLNDPAFYRRAMAEDYN